MTPSGSKWTRRPRDQFHGNLPDLFRSRHASSRGREVARKIRPLSVSRGRACAREAATRSNRDRTRTNRRGRASVGGWAWFERRDGST